MRRKLLIIGNSGDTSNYLAGVSVDINNYLKFFKSPYGGAWEDDQIFVYDNTCTISSLNAMLNHIKSLKYGYCLIVFLGHGFADKYSETYFELNPSGKEYYSLKMIKERIYPIPTTVIADSCRSIFPINESGGKIQRMTFTNSLNCNIELCRFYYDESIKLLSPGTFVFASAVSLGEAAGDSNNKGGYYSYYLLECAKDIVHSGIGEHVFSLYYIHSLAAEKVAKFTSGEQHPDIEGIKRGMYQPPFVIKI